MGCGSQKVQNAIMTTNNIASQNQYAFEEDMLDLEQLKSALDKQIDSYHLLNFNLPYQSYKDIIQCNNYGQIFKMLIEMQEEILKQIPRPYQTEDQRQELLTLTHSLIDMDLPKYFLNRYIFFEFNYKLFTVEQFNSQQIGILQKIPQLLQLKGPKTIEVTKSTLLETLNKHQSSSQVQQPQELEKIIWLINNGIEDPMVQQYVTTNYKILNILTAEGENDTQSPQRDYYVQYYQQYNSQLNSTLTARRQQLVKQKTIVQTRQ